MHNQLIKDSLFWGFGLWLIGYILGIILFMIVPASLIGWIIFPMGIGLTVWVVLTKIQSIKWIDYCILALIWTTIAIVADYFLLVQLFKPEDGYYKLDVYLYYIFTFILPLIVGWKKIKQRDPKK